VAQPVPARPAPARLLDQRRSNDDFEWDAFDSEAYFEHNYRAVRHDDEQIIGIISEFFDRSCVPIRAAQAIDVGPGANLYPTLAMLPFAEHVTLYERSRANCDWLSRQLRAPADSWQHFWAKMSANRSSYAALREPLADLRARSGVQRGNIFDLPEGRWDLGTMFFVAESITGVRAEFNQATHTFVRSLRPGAPFAAAFMKNSQGYNVGGLALPAFSVDEKYLEDCLRSVAHDVAINQIESRDLRPGYDGMLVVTGRSGAPNSP
jgi:hypothetical protein